MLIKVLFLRINPHQVPTRLAGAGEARLALALELAMEVPLGLAPADPVGGACFSTRVQLDL
jgi:hypothetical protein